MHPLKIANGILSLNELANGRGQIAIGAGEGNLDAMGLKTPKRIVLAVREALEIVLAAAHGNLGNGYSGEIFNVNHPCAYEWLNASAPRIYMTAYRFMMMRMGGRVADGVFVGCTPPEIVAPAMEHVNTGVSRRDQLAQNFRVNTFWAWHIKANKEEAYRESRRELAWRGRKLDPDLLINWLTEEECQFVADHFDAYVAAYFDRSGIVKGVPDEINDKLMHGMTSTGGLDDLDREIERFRSFQRNGLTEIALRLHDDPMDALQIIGERVVPALR
jgi:alkanesulfonate monooxygenase SsuD/methylene tetrahydromethanopterin reductase-like flavin-dependent oxidoreductase (luciferase family)